MTNAPIHDTTLPQQPASEGNTKSDNTLRRTCDSPDANDRIHFICMTSRTTNGCTRIHRAGPRTHTLAMPWDTQRGTQRGTWCTRRMDCVIRSRPGAQSIRATDDVVDHTPTPTRPQAQRQNHTGPDTARPGRRTHRGDCRHALPWHSTHRSIGMAHTQTKPTCPSTPHTTPGQRDAIHHTHTHQERDGTGGRRCGSPAED